MSGYKQCSNGHYYQGDRCPYCKDEDNTSEYVGFGYWKSICRNGHAYNAHRDFCPFCGEKVVDHKDIGSFTAWGESIRFLLTDEMSTRNISKNGVNYNTCNGVRVGIAGGYKYSYDIVIDNGEKLSISPDDELVLGRTPMMGKEFIKMCDVIIDNKLAIIGI